MSVLFSLVSKKTVIDWSSFCREVCQFRLEQWFEVLGGEDVVVETENAKIGHWKYNRVDGFWVFGGYEHGSCWCFLVPEPFRSMEYLLDVIKEWIRPGTTVISDCWKAYDCLSHESFVHQQINHSVNFVDPRVYMQNIERLWCDVRGSIPRFGHSKKHLVGYLAKFIFKRKFPDHHDHIHAFSRLPQNYIRHQASSRRLTPLSFNCFLYSWFRAYTLGCNCFCVINQAVWQFPHILYGVVYFVLSSPLGLYTPLAGCPFCGHPARLTTPM